MRRLFQVCSSFSQKRKDKGTDYSGGEFSGGVSQVGTLKCGTLSWRDSWVGDFLGGSGDSLGMGRLSGMGVALGWGNSQVGDSWEWELSD